MTVEEYLRRASSREITDEMAYDLIEQVDATTPAAITPRASMAYERLEQKLDRLWRPE
jgi:hypothetical protein